MDFLQYIANMKKPESFVSTSITKEFYIDIIEVCVNAYNKEYLENKLPKDETLFIDDIQAFSRVTCAIGILLSNGRKQEYRELWERMMDACCRDLHRTSDDSRVDFSVKEIMLAYIAMKDKVPAKKRETWLKELEKIDPYINYVYCIKQAEDAKKMHNISVYNMVGEFLRQKESLTDTTEYFDKHWPEQLNRFDENGMYMDPNCPILYDLATRCQIQIMMGFGYEGSYFNTLDTNLKKAGLWTLFMQSTTFQFPYGGRSNQFLFNEALIAANCEYEAVRYKNLGDLKLAGMFKRSAHLAAISIKRWLEAQPPRHIKNFYSVESLHGTEGYGYYDKYMVTLGCFSYIAHLFADDSIVEYPCPAETGGYIVETSEAFHKVFANCCGQSIEIDTKADLHYDSTGLGRYHKKDIFSELALSIPFTATPNYTLHDGLRTENLSIGSGWELKDGNVQFLAGLSEGLKHSIEVLEVNEDKVCFSLDYFGCVFQGCEGIREYYELNRDGLTIETEIIRPEVERIYFMVPLFKANGKDISVITWGKQEVVVELDNYTYTVSTDGDLIITDESIANRNGEYRIAKIMADSAKLKVSLQLRS